VRKKSAGLLSLVVAAGLGTTTLGAPAVSATPAPTVKNVGTSADRPDDVAGHELPNPMEDKRRALRQEALTELLSGKGTVEKRGASTVMKVSTRTAPAAADKTGAVTAQATSQDQYVELSREKTDKIFVVLTDFGTERHPDYPDKDLEPSIEGPKTFEGPENNQIPAPERAVDNSTVWQPSYDQKHFQDLYFGQGDEAGSGGATESVKQYFERQSSGRYSIDGTVTNWVKVRYNEARYGRSSDNPATNGDDPAVCSGHVCNNTWNLVQDAVNTWYADQIAKGRTAADVTAELKSFDQWDRYDVDNDGNFNEPDGYLDHFQIVHAGGDEADGDPNQGEDAIWSHRWYAFGTDYGRTGPTEGKQGGTQIGDTGVWVGDYTIQPENGGMSVFAHEYTHDLGLPDLYDTAGGENSVNYWSLLAQSREAAPNDQGIGTRASDLGAWDKLQLGWLNYALVKSGRSASLDLGPSEYKTKMPHAA
jgi:immune inhibitor A